MNIERILYSIKTKRTVADSYNSVMRIDIRLFDMVFKNKLY